MPLNITRSPDRIFVLVIAINTYRSDQVKNLSGCVRDITRLQATLQQRIGIPEQNFKLLQNEAATRAEIVAAFRSHFGQLRAGDLAVLYYSGHGSYEPTHPAFVAAGIEKELGRHESLVVHDYAKDGSVFNLSDKELRLLISELQYNEAGQYRGIEMVGILDCCFSGSMFRNQNKQTPERRTELGITKPRPLEAFLDQYYSKQLAKEGTISLPPAQYILMTACSPRESALENSSGGLFTQALCDILASASSLPTYADLHFQLHQRIKYATNTVQHPFLEYHGQVEPFWQFLAHHEIHRPHLPPLVKEEGQWIIRMGALHGIDMATWANRSVAIFSRNNLTQPLAHGRLLSVNLEHSLLALDTPEPSTDQPLVVELSGGRLGVAYDPDSAWAAPMEAQWAKMGLANLIYHTDQADLSIQEVPNGLGLFLHEKLLTNGVGALAEQTYTHLGDSLQKYLHWQRCFELCPPKNSNVMPEQIEMELVFTHNHGQSHSVVVFPDAREGVAEEAVNEVTLPLGTKDDYYTFKVNLRNRSAYPLYVYLVHLGNNQGIQQLNTEFNKSLYCLETWSYDSLEKGWGLAFSNDDQQTKDRLLVLFTRELLVAPYLFNQKGLEVKRSKSATDPTRSKSGRDEVGESIEAEVSSDWSMKFIDIVLERT